MHDVDPDPADQTYEHLRPLRTSIAYRMLGSVSEAEDVVQEAFLRFHRSAPAELASPRAYPDQGHDPPGHRRAALRPRTARAVRR